MRDIRFRAWDGVNMVGACCVVGSYFQLQGGRSCGDFMQFTGLHDKNGKEIYEGDIIKFEHQTLTVIWDTDASFTFRDVRDKFNGYNGNLVLSSPVEVIGNIHETPELLNE